MLGRHAERYPTRSVGIRMKDLTARLQHVLPFLEGWSQFFDVSDDGSSTHLEELTTMGKYSGIKQAQLAGMVLRTRYDHLVDPDVIVSIFSCSCSRVFATAQNFAIGFFGRSGLADVRHVVIPDHAPERGGDTLTPVKACLRYRQDALAGRTASYDIADKFKSVYLSETATRLQSVYDHQFTVSDLWTMQELCAFEMLATGQDSPWCGIFTDREWEQFAYARDLLHYYRTGPGTPYSAVMGFLYLNATREVLELGPERAGKLFFSFAHDGDIVPLIGTLGLFPETDHLPHTHMPESRSWKLSSVVPMGGRIVLERVRHGSQIGVRILVNDGVVVMPGCESETTPAGICPLSKFVAIVDEKGKQIGNFEDVCGLDDKVGRRPSFLTHNWDHGPGVVHLS
ncbi:histidine phosphatase superfamily [Lipomyces arxii]|uniref:histidine phosphatase superfamily n=1 Tax=Lipomyces arxii TaxID=56418 RepID=UPI0034CDFF2C